MNKIQVGYAPSPNLKAARSKIGSLDNATHKPGGGNVRIESRKVLIDAKPRIGARNELYAPAGGDKKVIKPCLFFLNIDIVTNYNCLYRYNRVIGVSSALVEQQLLCNVIITFSDSYDVFN